LNAAALSLESEPCPFQPEPAAAAIAEFERFRQMALADEDLHQQLLAAGTTSDFVALAVELGRSLSCEFDEAAVQMALKKARQAWWARWV
jgi:hypothetical protein